MSNESVPRAGVLPSEDAKPDAAFPHFEFMNPHGGEIYHAGSKIAIYWTGGPPRPQTIGIALVDQNAWQVIAVPGLPGAHVNPNEIGFYQWNVPPDLKLDPTHDYRLYIESSSPHTWWYGPLFKIVY